MTADASKLVERVRLAANVLRTIGGQSAMAATVDEAADALEAARVDAARYLWLRDHGLTFNTAARCPPMLTKRRWENVGRPAQLDTAIDAAMADAAKGEGGV